MFNLSNPYRILLSTTRKNSLIKAFTLLFSLLVSSISFAQESDVAKQEVSNSILETRMVLAIMVMLVALFILIIFLLMVFSDRIIKFAANQVFEGDEGREAKYTLFPNQHEYRS